MRICIVSDEFPEADANSGALRLCEILRILIQNEYHVTFLAHTDNGPKYSRPLEDIGIECISDGGSISCTPGRMRSFLETHQFDATVFVQYAMYILYAPFFRVIAPECRLILDTLDLHYIRLQREAELLGGETRAKHAQSVKADELLALCDADSIWVVTDVEAKLLSNPECGIGELGANGQRCAGSIHVISNIHCVDENPVGLKGREGLLFLGSYRHAPNVDAVSFFVRDVLPLLSDELPNVPVTIAGSYPPDEFHEFEKTNPNVRIAGFVEDHRALLRSHRVGIAPLRYGAGMKGKIGEYLSCGLPCVTTSIGAEGMSFTDGREVLIADTPGDFARQIVRLYSDSTKWAEMSAAGIEYIKTHLTASIIAPHVLLAVEDAGSRPARRDAIDGDVAKHVGLSQVLLICRHYPEASALRSCTRVYRFILSTLRLCTRLARLFGYTAIFRLLHLVTRKRAFADRASASYEQAVSIIRGFSVLIHR